MKTRKITTVCGMGLIFLFGVLSPLEVAADGFTCEIRATLDNYWLYIRDLDRDGNPTRDTLFRGWIMRGQTIPLTSRSGRISYTFKADSDYRDSGRNEGLCRNNRILRLP
ncbi:MAG: hypothetical protein QNK25_02105 [Desulfobacterales bacterium]|jgi:hypothetical protein|nr:hypothetical protein [Desulfobacterales bacterium]